MPDSRYHSPPPPRETDPLDGILVVDKPAGPTSHDIVARIRKSFRIPKVGHGGTLDPLATGVLVLLLGRATKLSALFLGSDKTYEGTMRFGIATDTQDAGGTITREAGIEALTRERVEAEMRRLTGDLMQTPPMVSAIKLDGIPLYKRARKGETVAREPRLIHIYEFTATRYEPPTVDFRVRCTKGTYVRTLCADIGDAIGCGAHLQALRRTQSGDLTLGQAVPMAKLVEMDRETLARHVIPMPRFAGGHIRR